MNRFFQKTFGGLSTAYYIRHFLFGLIFYAFCLYASWNRVEIRITEILGWTLFQFLYPYSRFVYESIIDYIFGNNIIIANAFIVLFVKFVAMTLCWFLSIFIAPVGLAYLYYHHTKQEKQNNQ